MPAVLPDVRLLKFMVANQQVLSSYGAAAGSFLPTDIAGLLVWTRNNTGLFQDSGKTTPAGNGDFVGAWADSSGNGADMLQTDNTRRPSVDGNSVAFNRLVAQRLEGNAFTLKPVTFFSLISFT